ncbi:MAG: hypothetical protein H6R13_182 [Proteobacteria bacterium]|nr:hypothetical protein [Pseudomonadota bacterium]
MGRSPKQESSLKLIRHDDLLLARQRSVAPFDLPPTSQTDRACLNPPLLDNAVQLSKWFFRTN